MRRAANPKARVPLSAQKAFSEASKTITARSIARGDSFGKVNVNPVRFAFSNRSTGGITPGGGGGGGGGPVDPSPLPVLVFEDEIINYGGLVAYYPLGEPSGATVDDVHTNNYDGTYNGSPIYANTGIPGSNHDAIRFDGDGDYAQIETSPGNRFRLSTSFSILCWFKRMGNGGTTSGGPGTPSAIEPLVTKGRGEGEAAGVNCNWFLGIDMDGASPVLGAFYEESGGAGHQITASTAVNDSEWHLAAFTYDGANMRLYLDGVADATPVAEAIGPDSASQQLAAIGGALTTAGANQGWFNGFMGHVLIFNQVRTPAELVDIYDLGVGGAPAVPSFDTPAGGSSGSPIPAFIIQLTQGYQPLKPSTIISANCKVRADTALLIDGVDYTFSYDDNLKQITLTKIGGNWEGASYDFDLSGMTDAADNAFIPASLSGSVASAGGTYDSDALAQDAANIEGFWPLDTDANDASPFGLNGAATGVDFGGRAFPGGGTMAIFNNTSSWIRLEDTPPQIGKTVWTINVWVYRTGTGTDANTGTGGVLAEPILTKGVAQSEGSPLNLNWWIGWRGSDMKAVADLEEASGPNHPLVGATTLQNNRLYMLTQTYDGATHRLYVNGVEDASEALVITPESGSTQHAAIGVAMNDAETRTGGFNGEIAKAETWEHVLEASELLALYQAGIGSSVSAALNTFGASTITIDLTTSSGTIDDASVIAATVVLKRNGTPMVQGTDYSFSYAAGSDRITLTSLAGDWPSGSYKIQLNGGVPA